MPMPVLPLVGSISVSPGLMRPGLLGLLDHALADAVLDRAAGVQELALGEDLAAGLRPMLRRRTIGVLPIASRMES